MIKVTDLYLLKRLKKLENSYAIKEIWKNISGSTSGTVTTYAETEIIQDHWNDEENSIVVEIQAGRPVDTAVYDSSGNVILVDSLDENGNYVLSGVPDVANYAIIWQIIGTAKALAEVPKEITIEEYDLSSTFWLDDGSSLKSKDPEKNIDLQVAGLKDENVVTAIKLGSPSDVSFDTTKKSIVGAVNELELLKANDDEVVHLAGDEDITGVKDFQSGLKINTSDTLTNVVTGVTDNDIVPTKGYVDIVKLQLETSIGTVLNYGGELSINASDNTKFDIAAGSATFVNNYTDTANPTSNTLTWEEQLGIVVTNIGTQFVSFIGINSSGVLIQNPGGFTPANERDIITLGVITHINLTIINSADSFGNWGRDTKLDIADLLSATGPRYNLSGNKYQANGPNLKLDKTAGSSFGMGIGYGIDKQNPNTKLDSIQTAINFVTVYRNTNVAFTDTVPNAQYDPNGDGSLIDIPDGYFTTHRIFFETSSGVTVVQYGQYVYHSLKKAAVSWEQEDFERDPNIENLKLRTILIISKGGTELDNPDHALFVELGIYGDKTLNTVEGFSGFAENIEIIDGMSYQRPSITFVNDGGIIYADVESVNSNNITYSFEQREFILDCTTGQGVSGRARVALTAGTATVPVQNYIYVVRNGEIAQLNASTAFPSGQFGWVCDVLLPDATTFDSLGVYSSQRYSDNKSHDGRGALSYEREKIRSLGVSYESGVVPTITITDLTPDTLDFSITSGEVYQLHLGTIPALASNSDGIYVINHPTTPWFYTTNLETIQIDANNDTLENKSFNFVFLGIKSTSDGIDYSHLAVLLPSGSYSYVLTDQALSDEDNTSVTSVPTEIKKTAFLIARITLKYKNGVWHNVTADETATTFFDLRGTPLGAASGGAGTPSVTSFTDDNFSLFNLTDNTKELKFDASIISTGQTRTIIMADRDVDLDIPIFSNISTDSIVEKTLGNGVVIEGITSKDNNLTIPGNLTVNGSEIIQNVETIVLEDNTIFINSGESGAGVTKTYAGLEIDRGTLSQYTIYFNETQDNFRAGEFWIDFDYDNLQGGTFTLHNKIVGQTSAAIGYLYADTGSNLKIKGTFGTLINDEQIIEYDRITDIATGVIADVNGAQTINDNTQAIATRENTPINTALTFWNSTTNKFETDANLLWDAGIITISGVQTGITLDSGTPVITIKNTKTSVVHFASLYLDRGNESLGYSQVYFKTGSTNIWITGLRAGDSHYHFWDAVSSVNRMLLHQDGKVEIPGTLQVETITIDVAIGTPPLIITSTTLVSNLNSDLLDSQEGVYYLARANHTGTQLANTISNFDTEVSNNSDVSANTTHRGLTNNPHTVTASQVGLGSVNNTSDLDKPISTATQTVLDLKANEDTVVHLTGAESVAGIKTFSSFIVCPSSAPTTAYQLANKKYVDDGLLLSPLLTGRNGDILLIDVINEYTSSSGVTIEDVLLKAGIIKVDSLTDGTLTVNGGAISGATTIGATISIASLSLSDTVLTITSGSISSAINGTFSGTLQAEQLISTDDASISGFTTLGSGNSPIKTKIITGTTATAGSIGSYTTGITVTKATMVVTIDGADGKQILRKDGFNPNSNFDAWMLSSDNKLYVRPAAGATNVASRSFRATLTYTE